MIIADMLGDVADLSHNPVSRLVHSTKKLATVDQILYQYDNLSKMYTHEIFPLLVTRGLVEKIATHHTDTDIQRLHAIDTYPNMRYIVNMKDLQSLISFNDTHELYSKHFGFIHKNIKKPRELNIHHIQLVVRKIMMIALSNEDLTNLRLIPDGLECARQFIGTIQDSYGSCFNFFYKEQLLSVVEEIFNPTFSLTSE